MAGSSFFARGLALSFGVVGGAGMAEEPSPILDRLHLEGPVYLLRTNTDIGNPSTVVSAGPDGVFVVDPNLAAAGDELERAIDELGGPVRLIVTTHYHGDHTEGLERFVPPAVAVAPAPQRARLATGEVVLGERPIDSVSLPSLTFEESLVVHFNGEAIELFAPRNRAGHTDGDTFVFFTESGVLCVGDYLFLDRYPIVDLEAGGDLEGYLANVDDLLHRFPEDTLVVPGHGTFSPEPPRTASLQEVAEHLKVLRETIALIREGMEAGDAVEEIVERGLPGRYTRLGERPRFLSEERWIRFVYGYYADR